MTKVLIFGGAGFVGYNLAEYLNRCGYKVTAVDNLVRRGSEMSLPKFKQQGIEFIHCDIRNKEDMDSLPAADVVLNCAAQPSAINYTNPVFDVTNNTVGLVNILEYCREKGSSLIFWSTNKCYSGDLVNSVPREKKGDRYVWANEHTFELQGWGNAGFNENLSIDGSDHSIYGASKIAADVLAQEWADAYGIPCIINRFSCLAGPNQWGKAEQGWVTWFAIANELGLPIKIYGFDGYQVRDCLFTEDINDLIYKQINKINDHAGGSVFNVGGGVKHSVSINEAINLLAQNKPWEKIDRSGEERRADQAIYISNTAKVRKAFDWEPTISIQDGYEDILKWVRANSDTLHHLYK